MPLHLGDELLFDGASGRVVAVTDTTEADGRGSVEYAGSAFRFRALKATVGGTDYPLVASADAVFRVGVVQQLADPTLFCLVLDDGPAPWGWGRRVLGVGTGVPTYWAEASEYADEDSVVFVMGWAPGEITILKGGVVQAGAYADFVLTYSTSDGQHVCWWQPAYPSNAGDAWGAAEGRFYTDANGVLWDYSDGTEQPIIVPRGSGALGYRSEEDDGWASCPQAERTLSKLEVWYLQEHAEVSEGATATLDVAAGNIRVIGPSGAVVLGWWEGSLRRIYEATGFDGDSTYEDLPPGNYTIGLYHPSAQDSALGRKDVSLSSGQTATVDFGGAWNDYSGAGNSWSVHAYHVGSEPLAGADVYLFTWTGFPPVFGWNLAGTTDANGELTVDTTGSVLVKAAIIDDRGCALYEVGGHFWDPCVGGKFGGIRSGAGHVSQPPSIEGFTPWGAGGSHANLRMEAPKCYLQDDTTEDRYEVGVYVSEAAPVYRMADPTSTPTLNTFTLYDADGTLIHATLNLRPDYDPPWANSGASETSGEGMFLYEQIGGKIEGNVVEASREDLITVDNLREAARMGLETGKFTQPLEVRFDSEASGLESRPTSFGAWECPYCGGPAWYGPDDAVNGYRRGYCIPCWAAGGTYVDCRTYFLTQTLAALEDWSTRPVKNTTGGGHSDKLITGWPRPAEYYESDDYLVDPWEDGLPRWVAVHIVLASLAGGVFTDGESIAQAEARVGDTIGPVQLKLQLNADYTGTGKTVRVTATNAYTGAADVLEATVPQGAVAGDLIFLKWGPHDAYPGARNWYTDVTDVTAVTDVTDVTDVTGDGALSLAVVNDGPSWRSSTGTIVPHNAYAPWACDARLGRRDPFLVEDFAGRLHLVYVREGRLMHRVLESGSSVWSDPVSITSRARWHHPCEEPGLAPLPHAELLAVAHSAGATRLWRTQDDGDTWS